MNKERGRSAQHQFFFNKLIASYEIFFISSFFSVYLEKSEMHIRIVHVCPPIPFPQKSN